MKALAFRQSSWGRTLWRCSGTWSSTWVSCLPPASKTSCLASTSPTCLASRCLSFKSTPFINDYQQMAVSKALGLGIVVGSSLVKLPQVKYRLPHYTQTSCSSRSWKSPSLGARRGYLLQEPCLSSRLSRFPGLTTSARASPSVPTESPSSSPPRPRPSASWWWPSPGESQVPFSSALSTLVHRSLDCLLKHASIKIQASPGRCSTPWSPPPLLSGTGRLPTSPWSS